MFYSLNIVEICMMILILIIGILNIYDGATSTVQILDEVENSSNLEDTTYKLNDKKQPDAIKITTGVFLMILSALYVANAFSRNTMMY